MSFDVGPYSIGAGQSGRWWVSWGPDHGAQWIMANPNGPGNLQVDNFAKEKRIRVPNALDTVYWVTVTNLGEDTVFSLQGGGNT